MTESMIETVARLKELEGRWQAIKETAKPNYALLERLEIERDMIASLPELLGVLGEVMEGDAEKFQVILGWLRQMPRLAEPWARELLSRYQHIAAKMEETR